MSGFGFTFKGGEVGFRLPLKGGIALRVGSLGLSLFRIESGTGITVRTEPTPKSANFDTQFANLASSSGSVELHVGNSLLLSSQGLVVRGLGDEGLDTFRTSQLVDPRLEARLREEAQTSQIHLELGVLPDRVMVKDSTPSDTFAGVQILHDPNLSV